MPGARIAFFVSGHGFGHAARACALIEELAAVPDVRFHVFSSVPEWFWRESLGAEIDLVPDAVDPGIVQATSLREDLDATLAALRDWYPVAPGLRDATAARLEDLGVDLVVADVAPLGIVAAHAAGLPVVLVENFTWDWILARLPFAADTIAPVIETLAAVYASATVRIQTEPVCQPVESAVRVGPLARRPRRGRGATREALGVGDSEVLALLSMGGVPWTFEGLEAGPAAGVRPLAVGETGRVPSGALALPHHSGHHHPDLVAAADVVVGKLGYSTLAETWQAGAPMAWVERPGWPETPALARQVGRTVPSERLSRAAFDAGGWARVAARLARRAAPIEPYRDGRAEAAAAVRTLLPDPALP